MSTIYIDPSRSRFFLVPSEADSALPTGELVLRTLTGKTRNVSEEAVASYQLTEDAAKAYVQEKMEAVQAVIQDLQTSLTTLLTDFAKAANPEGRLAKLLAVLEVSLSDLQKDAAGTVATIKERLMSMNLDKVKELAKAARGEEKAS